MKEKTAEELLQLLNKQFLPPTSLRPQEPEPCADPNCVKATIPPGLYCKGCLVNELLKRGAADKNVHELTDLLSMQATQARKINRLEAAIEEEVTIYQKRTQKRKH